MASTINNSLLTHVNYKWTNSVLRFWRLLWIISRDSLGQSDFLNSSICSIRHSVLVLIPSISTRVSTSIIFTSRSLWKLDIISLKPSVLWFFFQDSQITILPSLLSSHRLSNLQTSIWAQSRNRYSWIWIFTLCTNLSMPRSLRQSSEANLLSAGSMWLNNALHLKISGEARPPHANQDHFIRIINLLAVILTSLMWVLQTQTKRKVLVLPSSSDLVRLRRKIDLSSVKMPMVKAKLLTKYPSLMKLLWNCSLSTLRKIFFLLAFYRYKKIMIWKTYLPLLYMWVGMKKIVGWM